MAVPRSGGLAQWTAVLGQQRRGTGLSLPASEMPSILTARRTPLLPSTLTQMETWIRANVTPPWHEELYFGTNWLGGLTPEVLQRGSALLSEEVPEAVVRACVACVLEWVSWAELCDALGIHRVMSKDGRGGLSRGRTHAMGFCSLSTYRDYAKQLAKAVWWRHLLAQDLRGAGVGGGGQSQSLRVTTAAAIVGCVGEGAVLDKGTVSVALSDEVMAFVYGDWVQAGEKSTFSAVRLFWQSHSLVRADLNRGSGSGTVNLHMRQPQSLRTPIKALVAIARLALLVLHRRCMHHGHSDPAHGAASSVPACVREADPMLSRSFSEAFVWSSRLRSIVDEAPSPQLLTRASHRV